MAPNRLFEYASSDYSNETFRIILLVWKIRKKGVFYSSSNVACIRWKWR